MKTVNVAESHQTDIPRFPAGHDTTSFGVQIALELILYESP